MPTAASGRSVAQYRRQMENAEFEQLSAQLPIARAISGQHIDKTSVVRLASTFMRLSRAVAGLWEASKADPVQRHWNSQLLEILDGFLLCLSSGGDILYVSETISIHLGLSQVEMTGNSIYEYFHPSDGYNLRHTLEASVTGEPRLSVFRMRSTLTKRASKENPRSTSGFKTVKMDFVKRGTEQTFLCFCQPLFQSSASTIRLDNHAFLISTEINFSIRYVDVRGENYLGIMPGELTEKNLYHLVHPDDISRLTQLHVELFQFGASSTTFCRLVFLANAVMGRRSFYAEITGNRYPSQQNGKYVNDGFNFIVRPCN
uniref:PAS domain-containing protein n=1 Tax=Steinernema glaseri TaxID=37863 RepID=A0A1I7ZC42_9BILA